MSRHLLLAFLACSLATAVALAATSNRWSHVPVKDHLRANPVAANPESVAAGGLIYQEHCLDCHKAGARGDGRKRPSLLTPQVRMATDGDVEWFLRQGDLGHGMPSWSSLPQTQRWQLIVYLRSLQEAEGR